MNRRVEGNHALAHAIDLANELKLPVLYFEGLSYTYHLANRRFHTFVLEGIPDTTERLEKLGVGYVFYLRAKHSDPEDVLYRLAEDAALVVTDDYPTFLASRYNARVQQKLKVQFLAVDSSCIVPMNQFEKREYAAYTIRPKIHRLLPGYMKPLKMPKPQHRWTLPVSKFHQVVTHKNISDLVASCDIDQHIAVSTTFHGGEIGRAHV